MFDLPVLTPLNFDNQIAIVRKIEKPQPNEYLVIDGDNLTKIAEKQTTTVARLWAKNADLQNQDLLTVGQKLLIPTLDEELPDRPLYVLKPSETTIRTSGGQFEWGWCTFYADQQRPDIGATGNARDWIRFSDSKVPAVGAVAVNTQGLGHVAIVTAISPTQIQVRHMNWAGFGVISTDWIETSYWSGYIL